MHKINKYLTLILKTQRYNRKQDMPSEDGDRVVNWGPLTMAISNRKQDKPSEDGDWMVHRGPLKIAISNRK